MTTYKFANAPDSLATIDGSIGSSDISISLTTDHGAKLPSLEGDEIFRAVITDGNNVEWVDVTARSTDTLTVVRGTPSYSFAAGSTVEHRIDATAMNAMAQRGDFRTVTEDPDGSLSAEVAGEEVYNSTTGIWWKHCTGTTWKAMNS